MFDDEESKQVARLIVPVTYLLAGSVSLQSLFLNTVVERDSFPILSRLVHNFLLLVKRNLKDMQFFFHSEHFPTLSADSVSLTRAAWQVLRRNYS